MPVLNKGIGVAGGGRGGSVKYVNKNTIAAKGALTKLPNVESWARPRLDSAATSIGNYAIFTGGRDFAVSPSVATNTVDAYDNNLVRTNTAILSSARDRHSAVSIEEYAIIGSGTGSYADPFDKSLVRKEKIYGAGETGCSATSIGGKALFGIVAQVNDQPSIINIINPNLTSGTIYLSVGFSAQATKNDEYAVFWGAETIAYNGLLVRANTTKLPYRTSEAMGGYINGYAIIAGGRRDGQAYGKTSSDVYKYDNFLVLSNVNRLSAGRKSGAVTTVGDYVIFAGGIDDSGNTRVVDAYDSRLVKVTPSMLKYARSRLSSATIGNYALFAGGSPNTDVSSTVGAYIDGYAYDQTQGNIPFTATIPKLSSYSLNGKPWKETLKEEVLPRTLYLAPEQTLEVKYPDYIGSEIDITETT